MPLETYAELYVTDMKEAMRVYWTEMLYRVHLAVATSLIRHQRWLAGALQAGLDQNLFPFGSCLRGFIESAADSRHTLIQVPFTLAENSRAIDRALAGLLETGLLIEELEDRLVHYSHARRLTKGEQEQAPAYLRAKPAAEYISAFEGGLREQLREFYGRLCEVTHPAALSVMDSPRSGCFGLAGLPKLKRGVWHPYRRRWATVRKHLPLTDVAAAGGWRSTQTLLKCYQQPDEATMLQVVLGGAELRERA
jgi:hypothetical protein